MHGARRLIILEAHKASPDYMGSNKESRKDEETVRKVRISKKKGVLSVREKKTGRCPLSLHKWYTGSGLNTSQRPLKAFFS